MTAAPVASNAGTPWLTTGGVLSLTAAVVHLAAIAGGDDWYRLFGAGESIARAAERGSAIPALMTIGIAAVLTLWAAYTLSGAGRIRRLPMLRTGLVLIAAIYLARGMAIVAPGMLNRPDLSGTFIFWSSAIVLAFGLAYAIGTWRAWPHLSKKEFA